MRLYGLLRQAGVTLNIVLVVWFKVHVHIVFHLHFWTTGGSVLTIMNWMSFLCLRWTVDVKYCLLHRLCGLILAASNDAIYCVMGEVDSGRGKCIFFELSNWAMNINMQKTFSIRASPAAVMCSLVAMLEVFGISSGEQLITFLSLKPSHLNKCRSY